MAIKLSRYNEQDLSDAKQDAFLEFLEKGIEPDVKTFRRRIKEIAWNSKRRGTRFGSGSNQIKYTHVTLDEAMDCFQESIVFESILERQREVILFSRLEPLEEKIYRTIKLHYGCVTAAAKYLCYTPQYLNFILRKIESRLKNRL